MAPQMIMDQTGDSRFQFNPQDAAELAQAEYRLRKFTAEGFIAANIEQLDEAGKPQLKLCFQPEGSLVVGDIMLAQKIALETDELTALAVANRFAPQP